MSREELREPYRYLTQNDGGSGYQAVQEIVKVGLVTKTIETEHQHLPAISKERRSCSLDETVPGPDSLSSEFASREVEGYSTVLYLAYGSNLCAASFKGVRGIRPIAQLNVLVPELSLTFDLPGIAYSEPCFANVRYRSELRTSYLNIPAGLEKGHLSNSGGKYHKDRWEKGLVGVVYEVSKEDYITIIATEGGGAAYKDIVVTCYPLPEVGVVPEKPQTSPFISHTLLAPGPPDTERTRRPDPSYAQPSARYLKLLLDGADEHRLPEEYKLYLHGIRAYTITTDRQRLGRFLYLAVWMPVIYFMFLLQRIFRDKRGLSPEWLIKASGAIFKTMWLSYDRFFNIIFGDGERTMRQGEASSC
ncbi:MAG: hypothetical protein M1840_001067 [Geoglossum simile]|nr:MAG: hypothetical protein M1840_001067 [Geoglossum simile]